MQVTCSTDWSKGQAGMRVMEVMLQWLHNPNWVGDILLVEGTCIVYGYIIYFRMPRSTGLAKEIGKRVVLV